MSIFIIEYVTFHAIRISLEMQEGKDTFTKLIIALSLSDMAGNLVYYGDV